MRGQVDLIDFQSCSDGDFKWLMNYQDHATKFLHLRPLKSKHAANVAEELSKICFTWGAPQILQSDNGREFVAAVINELTTIWPFCKIVHGRPRHPQSQGSVERSNADVENMVRAWMLDNRSTN
ncbi:KRAB-A domain-containing protein 2-like [Leptopilina heterotoma]|uniref:KRAB-A domain-containing protein 2-like n=1 Tax=Leptopilina heterotoma TaxID=63436 RepID=UPI001CA844E7|nr:KRAB-A domain-containing protein 2-like [Leptopilina heterotoma]